MCMVLVLIALFVIGMLVLVRSSDEAIKRSINLAKLTGLSTVAIGFILLAIGTSLPELAVSVFASAAGQSQIVLGTLLGSNISDVTLILGTAALFGTITWSKKDYRVSQSAIIAILLALAALFLPGLGIGFGVAALASFAFFIMTMMKERYIIGAEERPLLKTPPIVLNLGILFVAIAGVLIGASVLTDSTISIARLLGIPEIFISGVIIAIGTSLPELAVSIQALRNGESGLALGNIAGSLVANLALVLGVSSLMLPIPILPLDRLWLMGTLATAMIFLWLSSRKQLGWRGGIGLIATWFIFIAIALLGWIG